MTQAEAGETAGRLDGAAAPRPESDALFLDFDGTLTEIVPHPSEAVLTPARRDLLLRAGTAFGGAAAIVSGRALADLAARTPDTVWRVGGHGDEIAPPGEAAPVSGAAGPHPRLLAAALEAARRFPGVFHEVKSNGLALHYRASPAAGQACIALMEAAVRDAPDYAIQPGKMVVEARPRGVDKGRALTRLMQSPPFAGRRPVMVGDDDTDEAAMRAAIDLGGLAVKVGPGPSAASLRLPDPGAVYDWLAAGMAEDWAGDS